MIKKNYGDVEVTVNRIEDSESETIDQGTSQKGLTSIAYAKRADNPKGAKYYANFVEEDDLKFGIAITRSV